MGTKLKKTELTKEDIKEIHLEGVRITSSAEVTMYKWKTIKQIIVTSVIVWGCFFSIKELAGKTTFADIAVKFVGNIKVVLGIGTGITGVCYGYRERNLRKKEVKRLANENKRLRILIDPIRGSSNLTEEGENKEEDII